jgi:transcriptional regulator with XRE-family HTH domain
MEHVMKAEAGNSGLARAPAEAASFGARSGPTVARMLLGAQLRRLREAAGITTERAGWEIRASHSKVSRLEHGRVGFKERDVADLLTLYGVTDETVREGLLDLVRKAKPAGWWHQYSDVLPRWFEFYVGLEWAASIIRSYEVAFIHSLLQTEDYARAVIRIGNVHAPGAEIERRVAVLMQRQQLLTQAGAPTLWAVLDEAALRRFPAGTAVIRGQLEHLLRLSELPNVFFQVMPFDAGPYAYAAAGGPFSILRFDAPDLPDMVYLEQLNSALYLNQPEDVLDYRAVMNRLCVRAYKPAQSREMLHALLKQT